MKANEKSPIEAPSRPRTTGGLCPERRNEWRYGRDQLLLLQSCMQLSAAPRGGSQLARFACREVLGAISASLFALGRFGERPTEARRRAGSHAEVPCGDAKA